MLFLIVFKNSCQKYEGAKALTLTCWQHHQFEKDYIKAYRGAYISIGAGLKSCSFSKHELYIPQIFYNVFFKCFQNV